MLPRERHYLFPLLWSSAQGKYCLDRAVWQGLSRLKYMIWRSIVLRNLYGSDRGRNFCGNISYVLYSAGL